MTSWWSQFAGCCELPVAGVAMAVVAFLVAWGPMHRLLGANSRLKQARAFFVQSMFVVLVLSAIAPVAGQMVQADEETTFAGYLSQAAELLGPSVAAIAVVLFAYAVLMAIMSATLGRYRDD